jgi:hypothetical protein
VNALGLSIAARARRDVRVVGLERRARTAEDVAKERADRRQLAIDQFKKAAQAKVLGEMEPLTTHLIGMCIQLRALGGNGYATNVAGKLREAADFLEDL